MSEKRLSSRLRPLSPTKYDIAFFIYDKRKVRWTHLMKEFVEGESKRHLSRQRLSDYLKELVDEGLVDKTVDAKALALRMLWRVYPIYTIPESRRKRIEELRNKKEIYEFIDSAGPEEIEKLHQEVRNLKDQEREGELGRSRARNKA